MPIKALLIRVPKLTNMTVTIDQAPEYIRGIRKAIDGAESAHVFRRVFYSERLAVAVYVFNEDELSIEQVDTDLVRVNEPGLQVKKPSGRTSSPYPSDSTQPRACQGPQKRA